MIDLQVGPERVLVMAVQTDQYSPEQFQVILDEMTSLTEPIYDKGFRLRN